MARLELKRWRCIISFHWNFLKCFHKPVGRAMPQIRSDVNIEFFVQVTLMSIWCRIFCVYSTIRDFFDTGMYSSKMVFADLTSKQRLGFVELCDPGRFLLCRFAFHATWADRSLGPANNKGWMSGMQVRLMSWADDVDGWYHFKNVNVSEGEDMGQC